MKNETSLYSKITQTGKHGLIYGIGSSLQRAISFLLIPLYTSYISTTNYGVLGLINITTQLIGIFILCGLPTAMFRSYYDYTDPKKQANVISTTFIMILINCIIFTAIILYFSNQISILILGSNEFSDLLFIGILTMTFRQINRIPLAIFRLKKQSIKYITFQISFLVFDILLITYFLYGKWVLKVFLLVS